MKRLIVLFPFLIKCKSPVLSAVFGLALIATNLMPKRAFAAEDLKLRSGISFVQDIDTGFPIVANKMEDCTIDSGMPTFIFFGASGDLNTNRQAKRVVDLYRHYASNRLKFVLIDVDHPGGPQAVKLIKTYYKGYIPSLVILTKAGIVKWTQTGEAETNILKSQIEQVL